jgi:hypothetical protein
MRTAHSAMAVVGDHVYAMGGIKRIAGKQVSVASVERCVTAPFCRHLSVSFVVRFFFF